MNYCTFDNTILNPLYRLSNVIYSDMIFVNNGLSEYERGILIGKELGKVLPGVQPVADIALGYLG